MCVNLKVHKMYICYIKGGHFYHDAIDLVSNVVF